MSVRMSTTCVSAPRVEDGPLGWRIVDEPLNVNSVADTATERAVRASPVCGMSEYVDDESDIVPLVV